MSKRSYNRSLKSLLPADFFREVTHIKHFIFQSSRWSTEQKHTIASQKMTLELFFSIDSFIILLVVMFFVIKPYLALTSTCSGGKPREQRDLEAGIPWNNEGVGRTGALGRQRVPVEHDERLCPGVSIKNLFMIELSSLIKTALIFFPGPSLFQALRL